MDDHGSGEASKTFAWAIDEGFREKTIQTKTIQGKTIANDLVAKQASLTPCFLVWH